MAGLTGKEKRRRQGKPGRIRGPGKPGKAGKTDYGRCQLSGGEWALALLSGCALGLGINWMFYRAWWAFLLLIPSCGGSVLYWRAQKLRKRKNTLYYHFRDLVAFMNSAVRSGYSLENAVISAAGDLARTYGAGDVLVRELQDMRRQMALSVPVEQLFLDLADRSHMDDIRSFANVLLIAKRTGGSMEEVFSNTWNTLCSRIDTMREIEAGIASRKYENTIMSLVPFGIILYIQSAFPEFMDVMYNNLMGVCVMTGCLLTYLAAWALAQKMLLVEV